MALCMPTGLVAMITQQSFMFLQTFEALRKRVMRHATFTKLVHLGPGAFEEVAGEVVNTAMFVFRNEQTIDSTAVFLRLVQAASKDRALNQACSNADRRNPAVRFHISQQEFKKIDGWPLCYWAPKQVLAAFADDPPLSLFADPTVGLQTGNNARTVRFHWETAGLTNWLPYLKGGYSGHGWDSRYFDSVAWTVWWGDSAIDYYRSSPSTRTNYLAKYFSQDDSSRIFKHAASFTKVSGGDFCARYLPPGTLFDVGASCVFPGEVSVWYLLAFLNSSLARFMLEMLNPTINYQVGDVKKLPVRRPQDQAAEKICELAHECVELKQELFETRLPAAEFVWTGLEKGRSLNLQARNLKECYATFVEHTEDLVLAILIREAVIDNEVFGLYDFPDESWSLVRQHVGKPVASLPIIPGWEVTVADNSEIVLELLSLYFAP